MTSGLTAALDSLGNSIDPGRILNTMNQFEQMKTRNQQKDVAENAWNDHLRKMESEPAYKKLATQVGKNFPLADVSNPQQLQQMLKTVSAAQEVDGSLNLLVEKGLMDQDYADVLRPQLTSNPEKMSQFLMTHAQGVASAKRDQDFRTEMATQERTRLQSTARTLLKTAGFKGTEHKFYSAMIEQAPREAISAITAEFNENERVAQVEARIQSQIERDDKIREEAKDELADRRAEKDAKEKKVQLATVKMINTTNVLPASERARLAGLVEIGYPPAQAQAYVQSLERADYSQAATLRQKQDSMDMVIQNINNAKLPEMKKAELRNLVKAGQVGQAISMYDRAVTARGGVATNGRASSATFVERARDASFVDGLISRYKIQGNLDEIEDGLLDAIVDMYELDDRGKVNSVFDVKDIAFIVKQIDKNQRGTSESAQKATEAHAKILGEYIKSERVNPHVTVNGERKNLLTPERDGIAGSFPVESKAVEGGSITGEPIKYNAYIDGGVTKTLNKIGDIYREAVPGGGTKYIKDMPVFNSKTLEVTNERAELTEDEAHWEMRRKYFKGMNAKEAYESAATQAKATYEYFDDMAEKVDGLSVESGRRLQAIVGQMANLQRRTLNEGRRYKTVTTYKKDSIYTPTRAKKSKVEIERFDSDHEGLMAAADVALEMQDLLLEFHSTLVSPNPNVNP